jgi:hypothetical protein
MRSQPRNRPLESVGTPRTQSIIGALYDDCPLAKHVMFPPWGVAMVDARSYGGVDINPRDLDTTR